MLLTKMMIMVMVVVVMLLPLSCLQQVNVNHLNTTVGVLSNCTAVAVLYPLEFLSVRIR